MYCHWENGWFFYIGFRSSYGGVVPRYRRGVVLLFLADSSVSRYQAPRISSRALICFIEGNIARIGGSDTAMRARCCRKTPTLT